MARGDFLVGVTLEETALRAVAAGTDVEIIHPAEGTSAVPDGIAQMKGAKHPENAAAFIRFVLSEDVQKRLGSQFFRRSVLKGLFSEGARRPRAGILRHPLGKRKPRPDPAPVANRRRAARAERAAGRRSPMRNR